MYSLTVNPIHKADVETLLVTEHHSYYILLKLEMNAFFLGGICSGFSFVLVVATECYIYRTVSSACNPYIVLGSE